MSEAKNVSSETRLGNKEQGPCYAIDSVKLSIKRFVDPVIKQLSLMQEGIIFEKPKTGKQKRGLLCEPGFLSTSGCITSPIALISEITGTCKNSLVSTSSFK